ncbi:MAG: serine/threonine-protein kinase [Marinicella sp.]
MNEEQGNQVKALFNACVDLTPEQQLNYLKNSQVDETIKAKVLKLLNYSGDIDLALSRVVLDTAKDSLSMADLQPGIVIEHYQLNQKIGEGGQGEVWLAIRNDGEFSHQVAIKFIKITASEKELQRFQTERELLATLQHPNIATLIGGGQFEQRLYMVMEWIDGVNIFSYLEEKQLDLKATLLCFLQVCQAVSHAHAKGIIHRDIKPSNILVTAEGIVKLLDFGIAKAIDDEITQTQADVMMTFVYSTPEQISGEHVTTATDVYALGLVLYEMLTNCKAQFNTESPAAFVHEVTSQTPPKPSHVTFNKGSSRFPVRVLQGDLDNLVMKAIRKEPQRRYSNADSLINDINNYLQNKPLNASGDGALYRLQKLLKRNPLSGLLAFAVLGFMTLLPILMYQYNVRLKTERDFANEQALIANKTTAFLTTLFESVSPLGHAGQDISLQQVLDQGERQLSAGMVNQPRVEAALSSILAAIYHHLNNTPKAISYYQKAVDNLQNSNDLVALLEAQGQLALMYFRNKQLEQSEVAFAQADQTAAQIIGDRETVIHLTRKATVATERGQSEQAAAMLEEVFNELSDAQLKDVELMSRLYHVWGEAIKYSDKEKALAFAEKSRQLTEQQVGKVHPFYLKRVNSQAVRLMRLDRHEEARVVLDELLQISESLYSENHPEHAGYLSTLGTFLHDRGYFSEAETVYKQSLQIYQKTFGDDNFETARMINNLAYLYEDMGQYEKALPLYQRSIELRLQLDPDNTIRAATAQANLARLLAKLNQHHQSTEILNQVMPIFEEHNRNNLYNQIIQLANLTQEGQSEEQCHQASLKLDSIEPQLNQEPATGWRRLGATLWISQLLNTCHQDKLSNEWLQQAYELSKQIYLRDADGRIMIEKQLKEKSLQP